MPEIKMHISEQQEAVVAEHAKNGRSFRFDGGEVDVFGSAGHKLKGITFEFEGDPPTELAALRTDLEQEQSAHAETLTALAALRAEVEAYVEISGYSPTLSCCKSASEHMRHTLARLTASRDALAAALRPFADWYTPNRDAAILTDADVRRAIAALAEHGGGATEAGKSGPAEKRQES